MAQPPAYNRVKDFGADYPDQTDNQAINTELDAVASSISGIRTNLAKIQRDDGGLANGIVTKDSLADSLKDDLYNEFSGNINDSVLAAQQAAVEATNAADAANADASTAVAARNDAQAASASAQASAAASSASQAAAAGSATSATNSAASATSSASAASGSAGSAATSATTATNAASAASTSATTASGAAATATTAKNDAQASATAAGGSATAAAGSAALSEAWATKTDGPVAGGQYSAKFYATLASTAQKWGTRGIGEVVAIWDHLTGAEVPPTNDPSIRYIKLTASDTYNAGVLTSEAVSGSAPLVVATAVINLAGSPINGATVNLINTERRMLRAGAAGAVENDALQNITGSIAAFYRSATAAASGALSMTQYATTPAAAGSGSGDSARITFDASAVARTSTETRPKNQGITYYMRIR